MVLRKPNHKSVTVLVKQRRENDMLQKEEELKTTLLEAKYKNNVVLAELEVDTKLSPRKRSHQDKQDIN